MSDKALFGSNTEIIPAGTANGILKRTLANDGWEFKTAAQLGAAPTLIQTQFVEQTIDTSTSSSGFVDLLTQSITTAAGSNLLISFTASASNVNANMEIYFQLVIDSVAIRGGGFKTTTANIVDSSSIVYRKTGMSAGLHTIKIQWRTSGNTARIRPATTAVEHASLLFHEVTV